MTDEARVALAQAVYAALDAGVDEYDVVKGVEEAISVWMPKRLRDAGVKIPDDPFEGLPA